MEVIPTKYAAFVLVILATFTESEITTLNVAEGDVAFLNFTYSCNSTEVTLQRSNGVLLYNSNGPTPPSSSNVNLRNGTDGKVCFLYLILNPVTRDDQGGYILTAYQDDPTLYEDDRIQLWVEYPPGKASCSLSEEHIDQEWVRLQCTAPLGNVGGFVMCYQNGIEIPPLNSPQEHDETLSQTLLAKIGDLVYCCSCTLDQTKDRCECKDSVWDPIQNKQVTNVSDPCPPTVPIHLPTFSKNPSEDNEFEVTSPSTEAPSVISYQPNSIKALYGIIAVDCFLILVQVAFVVCLPKRHQKKPPDLKTENHV